MDVRERDECPRDERGGQVSFLIASPESGSGRLSVTWVVGEPGSQQALHAHPESDQVYVVVRGHGVMIVDGEEREVAEGAAVLVRPGQTHAIRNTSDGPLEYVSATAPPFAAVVAGDRWNPA